MRNVALNFLVGLVLTGIAAFGALSLFDHPLTGIDDANIYFVYAQNLVDEHGFVYNVGGERVEGFTSLLWTLICALAFRASAHAELTLFLINIILLSLGIAAALSYLRSGLGVREINLRPGLLYSATFLILLLSSPRYIVWNTVTLMENGLWSTLLLLTTLFVVRDNIPARVTNLGFIPLSMLLILTRPEAVLWVIVFLGIRFLRLTAASNPVDALKQIAPSILSFILTLSLLTLFRIMYFGYPVPNTFYAKVSTSLGYNIQQGLVYLGKYIMSDPIVLLAVIVIVISGMDVLSRLLSNRSQNGGSEYLPILAGTGLLAPLLTGGDHFGSFRLYQNIYPILLLSLLYFVNLYLPVFLRTLEHPKSSRTQERLLGALSMLTLFVAVLVFQFSMWKSIKSEIAIEFNVAGYGRKNGAFIQELFSALPQLPSLGVVTSGGIKYSYEGEVVDLMGLNNTIMAHNGGDRRGIKNHAAFDIPTFYRLQPDIVWPLTVIEQDWQYSTFAIRDSWENREGLKGLFDEPRFQELYSYAQVAGKTVNDYALVAWFKMELLEKLKADPNFSVKVFTYLP
jgi:arabinofuranosyltransferase